VNTLALHSKWVSGNLVFYDSASTGSVCTVSNSGSGFVATAYYAGTTGNVGMSTTGSIIPTHITVVNGIVTACIST